MPHGHSLARQGLLRDLPAAELEALIRLALPIHLEPGRELFRKGDPPGDVYFIVRGAVNVLLEGAARSDVVARVGAGEAVGEMSALDGLPRSATVVVAEETEAYYLSTNDFARYLAGAPTVAARLLRLLATRLRRMVDGQEAELLLSEIWPHLAERPSS
jgi:CRP-like cAMP-binding protein